MATYVDTFTNTDGTAIDAHDANWTAASRLRITGNRLARLASAGSTERTRYSGGSFSGDDQYSQARVYGLQNNSTRHALIVRATDLTSAYAFVNIAKNTVWMYNQAGGSVIATVSVTISEGDLLRFEVVGTTGTLYQNGTSILTGSITRTGGVPGIGVTNDAATADDWEGGDFTTVGPDAPTGVYTDTPTRNGFTVHWTDVSTTETGFKVETAPSPYTTWTAASGSPAAANATSLVITGLSEGTSYKVRVAATDGVDDSAWVESSVVITLTRYVKIAGIDSSSIGETGVAGIVWEAPSGGDIVGAKVAEFTGKTIVDTSGDGGLRISVAELGGTLAPGDAPRVYLRGSTKDTPIFSATVADEV